MLSLNGDSSILYDVLIYCEKHYLLVKFLPTSLCFNSPTHQLTTTFPRYRVSLGSQLSVQGLYLEPLLDHIHEQRAAGVEPLPMDPTDTEAIVRTTRRFFSGMYQQLLVLWGGGGRGFSLPNTTPSRDGTPDRKEQGRSVTEQRLMCLQIMSSLTRAHATMCGLTRGAHASRSTGAMWAERGVSAECVAFEETCVGWLRLTHSWQERDAILQVIDALVLSKHSAEAFVEAGAVSLVARILLGTAHTIKDSRQPIGDAGTREGTAEGASSSRCSQNGHGWVVEEDLNEEDEPRTMTLMNLRDRCNVGGGAGEGGGVDLRTTRVKYAAVVEGAADVGGIREGTKAGEDGNGEDYDDDDDNDDALSALAVHYFTPQH